MFEKSADRVQEVVYLWDSKGINKEMMFPEFEAILDGIVGMPEFAQQTVHCVFAAIQFGLVPTALVFFTLELDSHGEPPEQWNLPFHQLIHDAKYETVGPHRLRLIAKHTVQDSTWIQDLWQPPEQALQELLKAINSNRLCLPTHPEGAQTSLAHVATASAVAAATTPQQTAPSFDNSQYLALQSKLNELQAKLSAAENKNLGLREANIAQKAKLTEELEQRQQALQVHQQELDKKQHAKFISKLKATKQAQLLAQARSSELETVVAQLEKRISQLSEELAGYRKDKMRLMANGADKFFEKLENSGLNFIAYHPGAGHVSVSVTQVAQYLNSPIAFAADKIAMSEEAYSIWLSHYEKPVCDAPIMGGKSCGKRIQRHENPKDFSPGMSDRCERHRTGVSAANRVFSS